MYQLASYLSALGQINKDGVKAILGDREIEESYIGNNQIVFMKAISGQCDKHPTTMKTEEGIQSQNGNQVRGYTSVVWRLLANIMYLLREKTSATSASPKTNYHTQLDRRNHALPMECNNSDVHQLITKTLPYLMYLLCLVTPFISESCILYITFSHFSNLAFMETI